MTIGIRALLADSLAEARQLAAALNELNIVRRQLEADMVAEAELLLSAHPLETADRFGVCVYEPSWHQGIVGIVAGRLRETINRPVIAFADAGDAAPGELKGSARSVAGLHIRDTLDAIATAQPGLLLKFGGHAMAAGLSLKRIHYRQFASAFDQAVRERLPASALSRRILTDGELTPAELDLEFARELSRASPWGAGFPEPCFHGEFDLISERVVGQAHLKLVLRAEDRLLDAIAFRQGPTGAKRVRAVYQLAENDYRSHCTLQLVVEHLQALA
jgi:single-stranded-DNA-specific exonuclease